MDDKAIDTKIWNVVASVIIGVFLYVFLDALELELFSWNWWQALIALSGAISFLANLEV